MLTLFLETKKHIHKGEEINEILIQMHTTNSTQKSWQLFKEGCDK